MPPRSKSPAGSAILAPGQNRTQKGVFRGQRNQSLQNKEVMNAAKQTGIIRKGISMTKDAWVLGVEGFVGSGTGNERCLMLAKPYKETGKPNNINFIHSSAPGDSDMRGLNRGALKGIFKRLISGHCDLVPQVGKACPGKRFRSLQSSQWVEGRTKNNNSF